MAVGHKSDPRATALKVLLDVDTKGAYSNLALNAALSGKDMDPRDRALVSALVYGTIKARLTLDHYIEAVSDTPLRKIRPAVLDILRLGVFQLLFTDKIPASAACDESVKLAAKFGFGNLKGYINAVLRKISAERETIMLPVREDGLTRYLSVKYSYPEWLVEKWLAESGDADLTEKLLAAGNETPPVCIKANTLKITTGDLAKMLAADGRKSRPGAVAADTLLLDDPERIAESKAFRDGYFHIQDEGSVFAAQLLAPRPGETVVDVCAAPGGKSCCLAQMMGDGGRVIARDIYPHKLELIEENRMRLGIKSIETGLSDAETADPELAEKADRVLADVPCSGLGIIRRKPELKWTRRPEDITELALLQLRILNASASLVKPGGTLVYSTCTISRQENEDIVTAFLSGRSDFEMIETHRLMPHIQGTDGFFAAKMRRNR